LTPQGLAQLQSDEGCVLTAYPDPLSGGDPWTIGYGSTGPGIRQGTIWSQTQADAALAQQIVHIQQELPAIVTCFSSLTPARQDVLVNMAYNIGVAGLSHFVNMISALDRGDWSGAAAQMLSSSWAEQVPNRAARLSDLMESGAYA